MQINGTLINLYHVCHRELWLHANAIRMEHTSETVAEGKLIGESSYAERSGKFTEVEIDGVKIDYYDARNKIIHEVKKSSKMEAAHIAQVKYYIWKLSQKGITDVKGVIEYPKLKQREEVILTGHEAAEIPSWEENVRKIIESEACPPLLHARVCKNCSYFDFCYSTE